MALIASQIPVAPRGLATSFEPTETPVSYALRLRNRFISAAGGAEKRQGMVPLVAVPTAINRLHELIDNVTSSATLFASGGGIIYRYDTTKWTPVYSSGHPIKVYRSIQENEKLIFYNGTDRPIYTTNGTDFYELRSIVEAGVATAGTDRDSLHNSQVTTWKDSDVSIGDIVRYEPTGAIGCVTVIATASIGHTEISSTAPSAAGYVINGYTLQGKAFKIIDTVENNIVPTSDPEYFDNVAIAYTSTSATEIKVSGIPDWSKKNIAVGDYVRNTTREAIAEVTAITTLTGSLRVTGVSGQVANDSLIFYKPAMPIPSYIHVHYGRAYMVDSRDKVKVRISGPNNPQDMTTDAGTLDSSTLSFGSLQPDGDTIQAIASYQRFLILSGKRHTFLYEGTDPIADTSGMDADFSVVGMFPQGVMSPDSLITVGNDAVIISRDGIQSFSLSSDSSTLGRENLSEALKSTLRDKIGSANEEDLIAFHYPKRSWVCFRIGEELYIYNYTPFFGEGPTSQEQAFSSQKKGGSWSVFDGLFAQQSHYLVRRDGDLYSCKGNYVYRCDVEGVFTDDGSKYTTEYQTAWIKGIGKGGAQNVKIGKYIQPVFNAVGVTYRISAEAPFVPESRDEIYSEALHRTGPVGTAVIGSYAIGGAGRGGVSDQKYPLLWRGKEVKFTITTYDDGGPDTIARLVVYYTMAGVR